MDFDEKNMWPVLLVGLLGGGHFDSNSPESNVVYCESEEIYELGGFHEGSGRTSSRTIKIYKCAGCGAFSLREEDMFCSRCGDKAPTMIDKIRATKYKCPCEDSQ